MTDQRSMIVDVVTCAALTGRSELPGKATPTAGRPSRAARATHLPARAARMGRVGCATVLENEHGPLAGCHVRSSDALGNEGKERC